MAAVNSAHEGGVVHMPALGFIATKPIQIVTSMILARQLTSRSARLSIVPSFAQAGSVLRRARQHCCEFDTVFSAPSRVAAIAALAFGDADRLLLDSDVGAKTSLVMSLAKLLRRRLRFSVYEEGLCLLEPAMSDRPLRLFVWLGATPTIGESGLTDDVWTYSPDDVRLRLPAKRVRRIEPAIGDYLRDQRERLLDLFWPGVANDTRRWVGSRCTLYLTSWQLDAKALEYLSAVEAFRVVKLHPHIRRKDALFGVRVDQHLDAAIPAELIVAELSRAFEFVDVLHDDSATARYFTASNVRYISVASLRADALQGGRHALQ